MSEQAINILREVIVRAKNGTLSINEYLTCRNTVLNSGNENLLSILTDSWIDGKRKISLKTDIFSIVIIKPGINNHSDAFLELGETLKYGLRAIGFQADIVYNSSVPFSRNIIFGVQQVKFTEQILSVFPSNSIIYNTEQISDDPLNVEFTSHLFKFIQNYETWDYSQKNIDKLLSLGVTSTLKYVPVGYVPELTRIPKSTTEDIDVLFYGSTSPRRTFILDSLQKSGVVVHRAFNVYGAERDALISRAKIVLNIHYYSTSIFESVRISYLLSNRKTVVSEFNPNGEVDERLRDGVELALYENLVDACLSLLRDEPRRRALAQRGFDCISSHPEQVLLRDVLGFPSHPSIPGTDVSQKLPLPNIVNLGSGKNWMVDYLNIDYNPVWSPDLIMDLNKPIPFRETLTTDRFGEICLSENQMDILIATDLLEHISDLTAVMSSCLMWLKIGGKFIIQVPYDLSLGAWQDPTHVRAFNENSWLYYTDWYWYLGWNEARFDILEKTFLLSEYGIILQKKGYTIEDLLRSPRAIDAIKVVLCKRLLTTQEKEQTRRVFDRKAGTSSA